MKVAIAQLSCRQGQPLENYKRMAEWISRAASAKAELVIFPEMITSGCAPQAIESGAISAGSSELAEMVETAQKNKISVMFGAPEREEASHDSAHNDAIYNSTFLITPGSGVTAVYRKTHLCPYQPFFENLIMQPGAAPAVVEIGGFKASIAICFDLRFPEYFRPLAAQGCNLFLIASAWPKARVKHWDTLVAARAIENQAFVVAANQVGSFKDTVFAGRSRIVDPLGETVVEGGPDSEELLIAEIAPVRCAEVRQATPVLTLRRPDLYASIKS